MIRITVFFFACLFIFSCGNMADDKVPEIADDYCKCFASQEKKLSKNTKNFIKLIAEGEDDQEVLAEERGKLSEDEQADVEELSLMLQDTDSKVGKCIAKVDKKIKGYKTKDENKFYNKLIDEMESRKDCKIMAYVLTMGKRELARQKKSKKDEEAEEEEAE